MHHLFLTMNISRRSYGKCCFYHFQQCKFYKKIFWNILITIGVFILKLHLFHQVISSVEAPITVAHIVVEAAPITEEISNVPEIVGKSTSRLNNFILGSQ